MSPSYKFSLLSVALFLLVFDPLAAQDLPTGEVDVIKDFNARLIETEKFDLEPELPPLDTLSRNLNYQVQQRPLNIDYPPPRIRPLAVKQEKEVDVYNGFGRLGAGFPNALWAEGNYALSNTENFVMDVDLFHHSANNGNNLENQKFSNTEAGIDGTYYFDQGFAVRGDVGYSRNVVHYYGYNGIDTDTTEDLSFAEEDVKQRFSLFSLGGEVFNGERTELDFNYSAALDFYHLQDNYSARENGFDVKVMGTKWFEDRHPLEVTFRADFTGYRDTADQSLNNFFLTPSYTYHGDFFRVKAGVNIAASQDEFFFFPDIEGALNIVGNVITVYAGIEGDLYKNNLKNLSDYNPFIETRIQLRNTETTHFYAGVQGQILGIDYQGQIGYKNARNLALFLANTDTVPRFDVLYDTVGIVTIKGEVTMPIFAGFNLTGAIAQNFYTPEKQEKAWHLPALDVNVGATYVMLNDRLTLKGDLFIQNGVPFRNELGEPENLNALYDLSVGGEFMFSDNFGVFAQVNNLLDNRRERWQHYPVLGLNAIVGLSARF